MTLEIEAPAQTQLIDTVQDRMFDEVGTPEYDPHGKLHHKNVKKIGDALAKRADFSLLERLALRVGFGLHDIVRSPSQNASSAALDELKSSKIVRTLLDQINQSGELETTEEIREGVEYAVAHHGKPPWDSSQRDVEQKTFKEKASEIAFIPDKVEQMDPISVLVRRSRFVPGERLDDEKGDLSDFGFRFEDMEDRLRVFVFESVIRLTHITPESIYPKDLRELFKPLFMKQRALVMSVAKAAGFETLEAIAKAIIETNNTNPDSEAYNKNLLRARKIVYPENVEEYAQLIKQKSGLSNEGLMQVSEDMKLSAKDAVLYLSKTWRREDLDAVINEWEPEGEYGKMLKQEARKYISGEWADQIARQILQQAA